MNIVYSLLVNYNVNDIWCVVFGTTHFMMMSLICKLMIFAQLLNHVYNLYLWETYATFQLHWQGQNVTALVIPRKCIHV